MDKNIDIQVANIEVINLCKQQDNINQIEGAIKNFLKQSELPPIYISHIAGIISEEPPSSGLDLYELIGEFVQNGNKVIKQDAQKICEEIAKNLQKDNIIKSENKLHYAAEKLLNPITLKEVELIKEKDFTAQYTDAFRGVKYDLNQQEESEQEQQIRKKKREKEEQQLKLMFEKFKKEQIVNIKKLPTIQILRNRNDGNKCLDLNLPNITMVVGGRALLEETCVKFPQGRKIGLIGRNGIGKTCLMNALARGDFEGIPKYLQILLVEQEVPQGEKSPLQLVLDTDTERTQLYQEEQKLLESGQQGPKYTERLNQIYERLDQIQAHMVESRAMEILGGLGFTNEMMSMPCIHLSGGWRMRVALARSLFVQPDILLLDEPTNHLDLDAVMWLEDYIINCKMTVVVVSHAREFLNVVCNDIVHFYDQKLTYYKGNYDAFEKTRSEKLKQQQKQHEAQQIQLAHIQSFIDKFRYNAKRASLVQSRIKAINKMELIDEVVEDPSCVFIFPAPEVLRPPLLKIEDGSFGYNKEHRILKGINVTIENESRMAIVGANGVGKSTLLKLLVGELQLLEGNQIRNGRLRCSYFAQHHMESLDLMLSPLEQFNKDFPGRTQESLRSHLGSFGISGNLGLRPQYLLSGGQKSRVAFARAVFNNPHLLILDEPTNHLDIDAVNALIIALNNFQGGVIVVSHDQHLVSTVCDEIWYIKEQRLRRFNGNFEDYRIALASNKL